MSARTRTVSAQTVTISFAFTSPELQKHRLSGNSQNSLYQRPISLLT